jgi:hypothetical protein
MSTYIQAGLILAPLSLASIVLGYLFGRYTKL